MRVMILENVRHRGKLGFSILVINGITLVNYIYKSKKRVRAIHEEYATEEFEEDVILIKQEQYIQ